MRAFLRQASRKLLRWTASTVEIDGLWVAADSREHLPKIENALRLIRDCDPRRHARLAKDLRSIWVTLLPGPLGQFNAIDWTCELDERFVGRASIEQVASTIVHEATHARLWRRGVGYEEDIRHRVEAICFRQEQAFAKRLPSADALTDELDAYLALPLDYWSEKSVRADHVRGSVAALRHLNMPSWLIGIVLRRHRAMRRRQRRAEAATRS